MKTKIMTIALIAITSITSQLFAQETAAKSTGYDLKKNVKCRVSTTETGCSIVFDNAIVSPRDAASGLPTGKRQYEPIRFDVSLSDNTIVEVKSPRDAASGMPTGKRQHKPMTVTKELDKSSPMLAKSVSSTATNTDASTAQGSGGGSGKVSMQDLSITKICADKTTILSFVDGECEIPTGDCPNGDCTLIVSWSWGESQSGTSNTGSAGTGMSRSSVDFLLQIEDGVSTAMAINEKGLPGEKKPKKTKTNNPK